MQRKPTSNHHAHAANHCQPHFVFVAAHFSLCPFRGTRPASGALSIYRMLSRIVVGRLSSVFDKYLAGKPDYYSGGFGNIRILSEQPARSPGLSVFFFDFQRSRICEGVLLCDSPNFRISQIKYGDLLPMRQPNPTFTRRLPVTRSSLRPPD